MHALPFLVALVTAAILAPGVLSALSAGGHCRPNYRSRRLPFPFGVLTLAAALVALIPLMLLEKLGSVELFHPEALPIALYALGVIALGLLDDTLGEDRGGRVLREIERLDLDARLGGERLDLVLGALEIRLVARHQHQVAAFLGQQPGAGEADPLRAAGDERAAAG